MIEKLFDKMGYISKEKMAEIVIPTLTIADTLIDQHKAVVKYTEEKLKKYANSKTKIKDFLELEAILHDKEV